MSAQEDDYEAIADKQFEDQLKKTQQLAYMAFKGPTPNVVQPKKQTVQVKTTPIVPPKQQMVLKSQYQALKNKNTAQIQKLNRAKQDQKIKYQTQIRGLTSQKSKLNDQITRINSQYNLYKTQKRKQIDGLISQVRQQTRKLHKAQQQLSDLGKNNSQNSNIMIQKKKQMKELQGSILKLQKQVRDAKNQSIKLRQDHQETLNKLNEQKSKLQQKVKKTGSSSQPQIPSYTYTKGQFNTYAVKKQKEVKQLNETIDKIIKQAISSHLNQVQTVLKFSKKAQDQSKRLQKQLSTQFPNKQMLALFIKQPVQYFLQHVAFNNNIRSYIRLFVSYMLKTYNISVIQNKIMQLGSLKLSQYVRKQNTIIIPSKGNNNTYLRIGKGIQPSFMFQSNNLLKSRSQLSSLSQKQRQTILNMVTSYLHDKNILVSQKQLQNRIRQLISKKV